MPDDTAGRPEGSRPADAITTVSVTSPGGSAAAGHIALMWQENRPIGLLHIVFHDPVPDDGPDSHGAIRDELERCGIPRSAVRLGREAVSGRQIAELTRDCRDGTVDILITNSDLADIAAVVTRGRHLVVHHLDIPRGARDAQQRAQVVSPDRLRTGEPVIVRYVTPGSLGTGWEAHDRKQAFIAQVAARARDIPAVDEGPSDSPMSYGALKALAAGDPRLLAKAETEAEIARLERRLRLNTRLVQELRDPPTSGQGGRDHPDRQLLAETEAEIARLSLEKQRLQDLLDAVTANEPNQDASDAPGDGAVIAEILTQDGEITLPAGSGADNVSVADARHLVDLVNDRVQPAGTPSFNSAAGTLTVPVPSGTVTISARNVTGRAPGGDPIACLARSLQSAGVPASVQLPRSPQARLWGVGTNIQGRLSALEYPKASPFRPDNTAGGRPVRHTSRGQNRPRRPPGR